ncbi:hypothetical protein PQX77_012901 [Marasmius sp. AFHP31]|nr:hypothetical protein PQX77_012901 [Marasmius sp. AFHP31]
MSAVIALAALLFQATRSTALNLFYIPYVVVQTLMQVSYIAFLAVIAHADESQPSASVDRPPFLASINVGLGRPAMMVHNTSKQIQSSH